MKITTRILVACLPGIVTGALFAATTGERTVSKPNESALSKAKASLGKLPLSFEPNRGQTDPRVQFLSRGPGYTVYFTKEGETVISLRDTKTSDAVVRMKFVGGNTSASVQPIDALSSKSNYLIGNDQSKWVTNVSEYAKLRYSDVYPGIDVLYQGEAKQLRYDFIVKPGANAGAIKMAFDGADKIAVTKDGDLALTIGGKILITKKPFTYQEDGGAKKEVASHYAVKDGSVTFELAQYDNTKNLVIDPTVEFITFLGGLLNDSVNGVAIVNPTMTISSSPSAYFVTGTTNSANFPAVGGVAPNTHTNANDVFVTKISINGNQILWSTYLGGNSQDTGSAVAVDLITAGCVNAGCPVVVGQTFSANFPVIPFKTPNQTGTNDAFAAKLAADGKSLIWSTYLGGNGNNQNATGVAVDLTGNTFVGGYTDAPFFLCNGNVQPPSNIPPSGNPTCKNSNAGNPTSSSDAFVVKIPFNWDGIDFTKLLVNLYGGFGEDEAQALAYNNVNNMVYLAGDTTTAAQNFIPPNNVNLPGLSNNTNVTGLPGPAGNARGGFVVAFDANTFVRTYATYVAVSPNTTTLCGGFPCNQGTDVLTGIAAEGGAIATCTGAGTPTPSCSALGNIGHIYITGNTTSHVPTASIALVYPGVACASPVIASSTNGSGLGTLPGTPSGSAGVVIGPAGTLVTIAGGSTIPAGCVTALYTQTPFATNNAPAAGCPYPMRFDTASILGPTCNISAFVAILDGALLTAPTTAAPLAGNQIEYWAYYSATNASTVSKAIAIDTNPTTLSSVYSLGTYQQMYITGGSTLTVGNGANTLPVTNTVGPNEIFTYYNVGTTAGGGIGGYNTVSGTGVFEQDAYVARFNANGVVAFAYGGVNEGQGNIDRSALIHTAQFNYGEFLWSTSLTADPLGIPNTIGNAIAVDPTRAALVGGSTNVIQKACANNACPFTTTNALPGVGLNNNGGTDGWASVLFFNDILTDAASVASANPFLQPGFFQDTLGISYIESTPAPYGPTFDFAISDIATQTQTFRVIFTGQAAGQIPTQTPFFVPVDARSGANTAAAVLDNGLPGSGIVYYIPCVNPSETFTSVNPPAPASAGYYNNLYPAPGGAYGPLTCNFPGSTLGTNIDLYMPPGYTGGTTAVGGAVPDGHVGGAIPTLYSGWPGIAPANTQSTPGWLVVSQDINPGVVRLQLDRRAAAGLLEGTYVAQFLVTTLDSQHPNQWPPCGPQSALNPFAPAGSQCTNSLTSLPADNVSILVTVRLVMRPAIFLSRNSGILTGVTSSLGVNPLFGPISAAIVGQPQGSSKVPDWLFTGANNNPNGDATQLNGTNGVNSGPAICVPGPVAAFGVPSTLPTQVIPANLTVQIPCPSTGLHTGIAPDPYTPNPGLSGATAYAGNGPGDLSGGLPVYSPAAPNLQGTPVAATPVMSFLYDVGTVFNLTATNAFSSCSSSPCNLSGGQNLAPTRPDSTPADATSFNGESQGGQDPPFQRNDATLHDYYVTAEGQATLSVAAVNCTNFSAGNHVAAVGNWLAVRVNQSPVGFKPICTDATAAQLGTAGFTTPVTACKTGACTFSTGISDDVNFPGGTPSLGGQQIELDFQALPFTNNQKMNGIPTGVYRASVYVWSTRAKNSVPGYCLGASMPASSTTTGQDPTPICNPSTTAIASTSNPNPEVLVTGQQMFNVTLAVFDTTQVIQITPNSCPTAITSPQPLFAGVLNSENLFTGNITPSLGSGSVPNYASFGPNGDDLVAWSLLPFQTTGTNVTYCIGNLPGTSSQGTCLQNSPLQLPQGVSVNAETLAQYNACALPTGTFNGQVSVGGRAVDGSFVPGIGSLTQVGPSSSTVFVPASNGSNNLVTIYACRPTVAPAWLNSSLYPGNAVTPVTGLIEPYSNGNGPNGGPNGGPLTGLAVAGGMGPVPSTATLTCALSASSSGGGTPPTVSNLSRFGLFRGPNSFLEDTAGTDSYIAGTTKYIPAFFTASSPGGATAQAGDLGVSGDWVGDGHARIGIYRPSTGQWFLDINNDGIYDTGDAVYNFGGLAGDIPVTGDWTGIGKACIGLYRNGAWLLDYSCNGSFDNQPIDGFIPFGGLAGDVPVAGNFAGPGPARLAVVRKYAPGGVPQGAPFLWVIDGTAANVPYVAGTNHLASTASGLTPFAFGGIAGDVYVAGDWIGNGTARAGIYRSGSWILDLGNIPSAHTYDTFFQFGGTATDQPIVGKW